MALDRKRLDARFTANLHSSFFAFFALIMIAVAVISCRRDNVPVGISNSVDQGPKTESEFVAEPISFCWRQPAELPGGKVQVLIDSSASMIGFQSQIPTLLSWTSYATSQLQRSSLQIEGSRVCQFSEHVPNGIGNCADLSSGSPPFLAQGDTNIHNAIRASKDFELTLIITDGVAATGGRGSGDCTSGVDASCVARAMADAIKGDDVERGIWVIPLIAPYDGKFFTEQRISPNNFNPAETINRVRSEIPVETVVQDPRSGYQDRLEFTYKGPRPLMIIVLARWAELGRATVQALSERLAFAGIYPINKPQDFTTTMSAFHPIEVYPGFVNNITWESLKIVDDPARVSGTIDVTFVKDSSRSTIQLQCPTSDTGEGDYTLTGSTDVQNRTAGCVRIGILPAVRFGFKAINPTDDAQLLALMPRFHRPSTSTPFIGLDLHLKCSKESPRSCDNPLAFDWVAYMDYARAADGLNESSVAGATQQQVRNLSTINPSLEPHRIYGLTSTLEEFYKAIAGNQRSRSLGNLAICHNK